MCSTHAGKSAHGLQRRGSAARAGVAPVVGLHADGGADDVVVGVAAVVHRLARTPGPAAKAEKASL